MHQSTASILFVAALTLSVASCAAPPPPSSDASNSSSPDSEALANVQTPAVTPEKVASPPAAVPETPPSAGVPVADFCAAGEKYLTRFPGLPSFKHNNDAQAAPGTIGCSYAVAPAASAPLALLTVTDIAVMNTSPGLVANCGPNREVPPGMTAVDSVALQPGWSAWKGTDVNVHKAMVCTPTHAFGATIVYVPGATPDDALKTIFAVMK